MPIRTRKFMTGKRMRRMSDDSGDGQGFLAKIQARITALMARITGGGNATASAGRRGVGKTSSQTKDIYVRSLR